MSIALGNEVDVVLLCCHLIDESTLKLLSHWIWIHLNIGVLGGKVLQHLVHLLLVLHDSLLSLLVVVIQLGPLQLSYH